MKPETEVTWQQAAAVFEQRADEYDSWYDDSLLFDIELTALQELTTLLPEPRFELGVGPGRFAEKLGVSVGIDPALAPLSKAAERIDHVCQGVGEDLPLRSGSVGTMYLLFTLCFTQEPQKVLAEIYRVLKPGGYLVLGVIPADGPWGEHLQAKKEADHPFYRYARFCEVRQIVQWLVAEGFEAKEIRASLFQPPDKLEKMEHSRKGLEADCGLALLVIQKGELVIPIAPLSA